MVIPSTFAEKVHIALISIYGIIIFLAPFTCQGNDWFDFANLAQCIYIQSVSTFLVCFWLLDCYLSKKFEIYKSNLYLPILALLLWSWLSLIWATNVSEGLDVALQWTACAVIFFVLFNSIRSNLDNTIILFSFLISFAFIVLLGLFQVFYANFNIYPQVISPAGTFANKNFLSDYLVLGIPIPLYFFINNANKIKLIVRIFAGVVFLLAVLLIIMSKTRAGFLAIPIMLFFYFFLLIFYAKRMQIMKVVFPKQTIALCVCLMLFFCLIFSILNMSGKNGNKFNEYWSRAKSIFVLPESDKASLVKPTKSERIDSVTDSTTIRIITWANTLKMIQDNPWIGLGLNNWQIHYGEYRSAYIEDPTYKPDILLRHVHNEYLQILSDLGLIGALIMLWLSIVIIRNFLRILSFPEIELSNKLKSITFMISLLGLCIISAFSIISTKAIPTVIFFCILALMESIFRLPIQNKKESNILAAFNFKFSIIICGCFFILACYGAILELNRGVADKLKKTAIEYNSIGDYDQVINICEKLLKDHPLQYKMHFMLGATYLKKDRLEEASNHLEQGLQYYPNELTPLFLLGSVYVLKIQKEINNRQSDLSLISSLEERAFYWFNRAIKIRSDFEKPWNNIGFIYEKQAFRLKQEGKLKEFAKAVKQAEESYSKAIRLNSSYIEAVINKASLQLQTGQQMEAINLLKSVLQKTSEAYSSKDQDIQALRKGNFLENKDSLNRVSNERIIKRQEYIRVAPKIIKVLKQELLKLKNYQEYLSILEYDFLMRKLQLEEELEQLKIVSNEIDSVNKDASRLRSGITLQQLEDRLKASQRSYDKMKESTAVGVAQYYLEKGEIFQILNLLENAISEYKKVEALGGENILEQKSMALLKINEIYLNTAGDQLPKLYSIIEENFEKATFTKNPSINESKSLLMKLYSELKLKLNH